MFKHMVKRMLQSLVGNKHHSHGHGYHHYSSSDYKKGYNHPQNRPPYYPPKGHGYYKKKYSSFSS